MHTLRQSVRGLTFWVDIVLAELKHEPHWDVEARKFTLIRPGSYWQKAMEYNDIYIQIDDIANNVTMESSRFNFDI